MFYLVLLPYLIVFMFGYVIFYEVRDVIKIIKEEKRRKKYGPKADHWINRLDPQALEILDRYKTASNGYEEYRIDLQNKNKWFID